MPQIMSINSWRTWNIPLICSASLVQRLHVLKAVETAGAAGSDLISTLSRCVQNHSVPLELRLAAIRAFRRIPCHHDVSITTQQWQSLHWCYVYYGIIYIIALCSFLCYQRRALTQAFQRQQENVEVRIAAYQQLMHCPNQEIFTIVKKTLRNEKSSQGIEVTQMYYIKSTLSQKVWNSNIITRIDKLITLFHKVPLVNIN